MKFAFPWRSIVHATLSLVLGAMLAPSRAAGGTGAPLLKQDPQADITDVYAFVGTKYNNPTQRVLNIIVHVRPFSVPGDGGAYDRFADDALYSIHVTHPTTGETFLRYDFQFSAAASGYKNPNTIFSYGLGTEIGPILASGDQRQNYAQTYKVTRVLSGSSTVVGADLSTPPPNVGVRTTPHYNAEDGRAISGATSVNELDLYTRTTIHALTTGEAAFAGPREDGFYADLGGIFDLLSPRILGGDLGQAGGGVDQLKGYNVLAYALQIPISSMPAFEHSSLLHGVANGVGVYASVSRRQVTIRRTSGSPDPVLYSADCNGDHALDISDAVCLLAWLYLGSRAPARIDEASPWVQVSRMGNPLFNQMFVAVKDKDRYNGASPSADADPTAGFKAYARNPELAALFNLVYGTSISGTGRDDLAALYVPDVIRVDTTTAPVRLPGKAGFSRLGFLGGDTLVDGAGRAKSSGWPNGRRIGDDVVDILLTLLISGPSYATFVVMGDNVHANDQLYHQVFPYSATPHAGATDPRN
jgi:hypothetical protein